MSYQTVRLKIPSSVERHVKAGTTAKVSIGGLSGNDTTTLRVTVDIIGFAAVTPGDVAVLSLEQSWTDGTVFEVVPGTIQTDISADGVFSIRVTASSGVLAPIVNLVITSAATASFYVKSVFRTSSTENGIVPVAAGSTVIITNPSGTAIDFGAGATTAATTRVVASTDSPEVVSLANIEAVDFATETTLDLVLTDTNSLVAKDFATETTLDLVLTDTNSLVAKDFATETTLDLVLTDTNSLVAKDFATETTLDLVLTDTNSLVAKDFATQTTLAALLAKLGGSLVPSSYDSISADYSGATTNVFTYKQGLTTVAILTVTYIDSTKAKFSSVVRT